jgi:hypothetical protein
VEIGRNGPGILGVNPINYINFILNRGIRRDSTTFITLVVMIAYNL